MMSSPDSPVSAKKKRAKAKHLLKINAKTSKKKNRFKELTFIESHMETFYGELNGDLRGAYNPVHAKLVDLEEAPDIVKNWVKYK